MTQIESTIRYDKSSLCLTVIDEWKLACLKVYFIKKLLHKQLNIYSITLGPTEANKWILEGKSVFPELAGS